VRLVEMIREQSINILYISPESLSSELIWHIRDLQNINFICIDEAHCISEWSHNFRTSYLTLAEVLRGFRNPPVLALTATATCITQNSIV